MNSPPFPDNSEILFGREQDLAYLEERAAQRGITAVVARPQMGKSWLLTELARRLSFGRAPHESPLQTIPLSSPVHFLVGFSSAEGSTPDQMLRAVADLYTRWLAVSNYQQQARLVFQQHKDDLVGTTGEAVGTIFMELSKMGGKSFEAIGRLVKETFAALVSANRDLLSGGMQLPRLQSEQARDLLALLYKITSVPIMLVLDQWEKSSDPVMERNILDEFLRHLQGWPPCHIFLGVRDGTEVRTSLRKLKVGFSGEMEVYSLSLMRLDEVSGPALVAHIQSRVPAASAVSPQDLLRIISGYPGTVSIWTKPHNVTGMRTAGDLQARADEAQKDHYEEFNTIFPQLTDEERPLAMRLALTPACADKDAWDVLRPTVLNGSKANLLDSLMRKEVLERALPPTYGHATRGEFACHWFKKNCPVEISDVCEQLITALAGRFRDLEAPDSIYSANALIGVSGMAKGVVLPNVTKALLIAANSLVPDRRVNSQKLLGISSELGGGFGVVAPLLAMGLLNTLSDSINRQDLKRGDALLAELRTLARVHPDDAFVRLALANGLSSALRFTKQEHELSVLRFMSPTGPRDNFVELPVRGLRENSLVNTFNHAKQEQNLRRRDALLAELRTLAGNHPQESHLRVSLAIGVHCTLAVAQDSQDPMRGDALLKELRTLAGDLREQAFVRFLLAKSLFDTLVDPKGQPDLRRRDALLAELRALADDHPDDAHVREQLARGLIARSFYAGQEHDLNRRDALLEELRTLAGDYPDDTRLLKLAESAAS